MLAPAPRPAIRAALALAGLAALSAVSLDCGLIIGAGDYQVGTACPAGPCTCGGFAWTQSSCPNCVETNCCMEGDACRKDEQCAALYDCLATCGTTDGACRDQCRTLHPAGSSEAALALEQCQAQSCGNTCVSCGGLADWYADTCAACAQSSCCDAEAACAADAVCAERQRCYRACTYPSCPIDCDAQIAASSGQSLDSQVIRDYDTCTSKTCGKQCAYGAEWGCVGAFNWPAPTEGEMVAFTVHTTAFLDSSNYKDVTIRACPRSDYDCQSPIDTQKTGADGLTTLHVPSGFTGYFDATADNTLESLVYLSWPLVRDATYELQLGPYSLYQTLVMSGGGTVDDTKGAVFVYTEDCLGNPAPGIKLGIDPLNIADAFYFLGGSPVATQMETAAEAIGGYSNVDPGTVTLTATLSATMKQVASFTVQVRKQTLTFVSLTPTP
jgi:hypothetical protein